MVLICFVGIDGSGKTTNAKRLAAWLAKKDVKVKYIWSRFDPFLLRLPALLINKLIFSNNTRMVYDRYSKPKGKLLNNIAVYLLYQYVLLFDSILSTIVRVWPYMHPSELVVICDRFVYDAVVCLADDLKYYPKKVWRILNLAIKAVPKPDLVFLIDVPETIAFQRKNDIASPEFISRRRQFYLLVGELCRMNKLDGSKSLEELDEIIRPMAEELLGL